MPIKVKPAIVVGQVLHASVADTVYVTGAVHDPDTALTEIFAGQVNVGGVESTGVTIKVQVLILPDPSVAVIVIVVAEVMFVPAAGLCVIVIELDGLQLSVAVIEDA